MIPFVTGNITVAMLIPTSLSGWKTNIIQLSGGTKHLFRHDYVPQLVYASGATAMVYEALEEDIGFGEDVLTSVSPWPKLWNQEYPEPAVWRGTFYPVYHHKVLFSKTVTIQNAKLIRWNPNAKIQIRTFEPEND
jgi:hypothetical protein